MLSQHPATYELEPDKCLPPQVRQDLDNLPRETAKNISIGTAKINQFKASYQHLKEPMLQMNPISVQKTNKAHLSC